MVTSAPQTDCRRRRRCWCRDGPSSSANAARADGIPNGAGDLFAGLLLGHLLNGHAGEAALDASLAILDRVLAASEGQACSHLSALNASTP